MNSTHDNCTSLEESSTSGFWNNNSDVIKNCSTRHNVTDSMIGGTFDQSNPWSDIAARVAMYISFVIMPGGFLLNSVCLVIFVKSRIAKSATGIHLAFIAVADNVILVSLFLYNTKYWSEYTNIPNLRNYGFILCTGPHFAAAVGLLWTGILLASATIERFASVAFPLKVKMWNLYKKSTIMMVVYFVSACILTGYELLCYTMKTVFPNDEAECVYSEKYAKVCNIFDTIVNSVLSNGICFCLILIFTVLTSIFLHRAKRMRPQLGQKTNSETNREFQITLMLVVVAILFLIFRIPEMILYQMRGTLRQTTSTILSLKMLNLSILFLWS